MAHRAASCSSRSVVDVPGRRRVVHDPAQFGPCGRGDLSTRHEDLGQASVHQQAPDRTPVAGPEGPPQRARHVATAPVPLRGADVAKPDAVGRLPVGQMTQHLAEQLVVPERRLRDVDGNDERVRAGQRGQHRTAVGQARDRLRQRPGDLVEEARLDQQPGHVVGLPGEHLLRQILTDAALVHREQGDELGRPRRALHPQGSQPQAGRPALGAVDEERHLVVGQLHVVRAQQLPRLRGGHRQVGRAELVGPPGHTMAVQRQQRVAARRHHQLDPVRPPFHQTVEAVEDPGVGEHVGVVEHDGQPWLRRGDAAVDGVEQLHGVPGVPGDRRELLTGSLGAFQELLPEPGRIVVLVGQRQPGHRRLATASPVGQQNGLARARPGTHENQRVCRGLVQTGEQPRARHVERG